jgi:hypothetical protein
MQAFNNISKQTWSMTHLLELLISINRTELFTFCLSRKICHIVQRSAFCGACFGRISLLWKRNWGSVRKEEFYYLDVPTVYFKKTMQIIGNCIFVHRQLKEHWNINPSVHCMYRLFNIHQFYVLPTQSIYGSCVDISRKNSDYFPIQH